MKFPVVGVLAVFLLLGAVGVRDAAAVNLGPLVAQPYLAFNAKYDDNVFVQNKGSETPDWYFIVSPGMLLQLRQRDNQYELEYKADIYRYVDTGDSNDVSDQFLRGAFYFNFPGGLSIKLDDLFSAAHEQRSESNLAVTGTTPISRFYSNNLTAEVAYDLSSRLKTALTYKYYTINYILATSEFRDRDENSGDLTVYYKVQPKTSVLLEGIYKNIIHTDKNDPVAHTLNSDEYWAMAGLYWNITEKSTGVVKGGYEFKRFRFAGRKSFDSPVYQVSIIHSFTPKTGFTLSGTRQAIETDDPAVAFYTTTNGYFELRYRPVTKIEVKPNFSYTYNRYSGPTTVGGITARRVDHWWSGGIEATYDIQKWLAFSVGYKHTKRSSDLPFYDYTDNLAMARFTVSM